MCSIDHKENGLEKEGEATSSFFTRVQAMSIEFSVFQSEAILFSLSVFHRSFLSYFYILLTYFLVIKILSIITKEMGGNFF